MRFLLLFLAFALALGLPCGAAAQATATFADSVLTVTGTDGDDFITIGCAAGNAQLDGVDIPEAICIEVAQMDVDLMGGVNAVTLADVVDFALNPGRPSSVRATGNSSVEVDLSGYTDDLLVSIDEPVGSGVGGHAAGRPDHSMELAYAELFSTFVVGTIRFFGGLDLFGLAAALGSGNDSVVVDPGLSASPKSVTVFGGPGGDTVDLSAVRASVFAGLEVSFSGQEGDDAFLSPSDTSETSDVSGTVLWVPGGGTDRFTPGPGPDAVTLFGGSAPLTIHEISGTLGAGCSFFDVDGGGGVLLDGNEKVEEARYFMPAVGGDVFAEAECAGIERDLSWGNGGPDWFHYRGHEGGGTLANIDFSEQVMTIENALFEGRDVSSWSSGGVPTLWDGIDYQDWPSSAAPSTSGPSTVVIRGRPDFPLEIDLGPDGGPGFGTAGSVGGAADTLWVDPLGLPFTDDGSQIVIDGGPPITYAGAESVTIGARPTAGDDGPLTSAAQLTVAPNPLGRDGRVRLEGARPGPARVAVFDLLGREVAVLHEGPLGASAETWAVPGRRLAAGAYVVRAAGEGWAVSRVVTVSR